MEQVNIVVWQAQQNKVGIEQSIDGIEYIINGIEYNTPMMTLELFTFVFAAATKNVFVNLFITKSQCMNTIYICIYKSNNDNNNRS